MLTVRVSYMSVPATGVDVDAVSAVAHAFPMTSSGRRRLTIEG